MRNISSGEILRLVRRDGGINDFGERLVFIGVFFKIKNTAYSSELTGSQAPAWEPISRGSASERENRKVGRASRSALPGWMEAEPPDRRYQAGAW